MRKLGIHKGQNQVFSQFFFKNIVKNGLMIQKMAIFRFKAQFFVFPHASPTHRYQKVASICIFQCAKWAFIEASMRQFAYLQKCLICAFSLARKDDLSSSPGQGGIGDKEIIRFKVKHFGFWCDFGKNLQNSAKNVKSPVRFLVILPQIRTSSKLHFVRVCKKKVNTSAREIFVSIPKTHN